MVNTTLNEHKKATISILFDKIIDILKKENIGYCTDAAEHGDIIFGYNMEWCYESDCTPYWEEDLPIIKFIRRARNYSIVNVVDINLSDSDAEILRKIKKMEYDLKGSREFSLRFSVEN